MGPDGGHGRAGRPPGRAEPPGVVTGSEKAYRWRIGLVLALAATTVPALAAVWWTLSAARAVDVAEAERDGWQRPAEVVRALDVREGKVVVDLGSGVGYFALKLATVVGRRGRVVAVDVRRFPLLFLRVRALLRARRNLETVLGETGDPHLPAGGADAVLVANALHEIEDKAAILGHVREALHSGGRLVVVDPGPDVGEAGSPGPGGHHHDPPDAAEGWLRQAGFEIVRRDDRFTTGPGQRSWWLIVARRP